MFSDNISEDVIKEFLGRLSGFVHKAKSLHWAASGKDIHEYLDEIWEETYKFQDTVAEGWMGINGQLDSDIPFLMPESKNPESFIREVEEKTTDTYNLLPDDPKYSGLKGEFESFIQTIEKYKYLFGLTEEEKEFSDKKKDTKEKIVVGVGSTGLILGGGVVRRSGKKNLAEAEKLLESAETGRLLAGLDSEKVGRLKDKLKGAKTAEEYNAIVDKINAKLAASKAQHAAADKEISEAAIKKFIGKAKKTAGKGLIIAGATLPAAYVIHRKKIKKREKKASLEKLENGRLINNARNESTIRKVFSE